MRERVCVNEKECMRELVNMLRKEDGVMKVCRCVKDEWMRKKIELEINIFELCYR